MTQAPKSFDEVFQESQTSAQEKALLGDDAPTAPSTIVLEGMPDWALVPADLALPPGKEVAFMRFRGAWTDFPAKGDRQCILWALTDADEKQAAKRARGDTSAAIRELAKACIRAVDGHRADWTGRAGPGDPNRFWNEVGAKCRQMVTNYYFKTHALTQEEQADFFQSCFVVANPTVG